MSTQYNLVVPLIGVAAMEALKPAKKIVRHCVDAEGNVGKLQVARVDRSDADSGRRHRPSLRWWGERRGREEAEVELRRGGRRPPLPLRCGSGCGGGGGCVCVWGSGRGMG